tara:strand:+ start:955 stop:1176 length:222 start_codon:yes stop_codon:yes gene_type:complete
MIKELTEKMETGVLADMGITPRSKMSELGEAAKPVMKFLNENYHPHVKVIIDPNRAELLEGKMSIINNEFIKD